MVRGEDPICKRIELALGLHSVGPLCFHVRTLNSFARSSVLQSSSSLVSSQPKEKRSAGFGLARSSFTQAVSRVCGFMQRGGRGEE